MMPPTRHGLCGFVTFAIDTASLDLRLDVTYLVPSSDRGYRSERPRSLPPRRRVYVCGELSMPPLNFWTGMFRLISERLL